jgi:hypothetical protein
MEALTMPMPVSYSRILFLTFPAGHKIKPSRDHEDS